MSTLTRLRSLLPLDRDVVERIELIAIIIGAGTLIMLAGILCSDLVSP